MSVHAISFKSIRAYIYGLAVATLLTACGVQAQLVSADFGSRNGATPVVPSGLLTVGGTGSSLTNSAAINTMTSAGLNHTRFWINLNQIYATSTGNFTSLGQTLARMKAAGIHPLGVVFGTPASLAPSTCSAPSNVKTWGEMAAAVVAYADKNYPGVLQDYEIWNEPELANSLCITDDTARLNAYVSMFASAASAMHAQAKADGQPIRTGGPVISRLKAMGPIWIPALLSNTSTAPYVDFVSYHIYLSGLTNIQAGMNWAQLYAMTQSTSGGLAYYYKLLEPLVRQGHQPNAASTPIYVSEFNDGWAFAVDCCRNDPTYGPLWNGLAITDMLNVVYSGMPTVPSKLGYFNATGNFLHF